ncbi:MAG: hypothetical protein HYV07_13265 [Deltaproteobacteria bacterium]|nr:hypothetical protein [Deltaproteobacteria bacterium]
MSSDAWLYRFECKGIQSWILATDRLRDLKGGSTIIEELADEARKRAVALQAKVHSTAAGGGELEFSSFEALQSFASEWPMFVSDFAPGLQMVQAWIPPGAEPTRLYERLGAARNHADPMLPEVGPWVARSGRTGRAAIGTGAGRTLEDEASRRKQDAASRDPLSRIVADISLEDDYDRWPSPYVAVVHADGNRVGERVQGFLDPGRKAQFARALSGCTRDAFKHALEALVVKGHGTRTKVPARPIVVGGDDMTIVIEAQHGVAFTHDYLAEFQACAAKSPLTEGLTASAGIAFVKSGYPFHRAYKLSERLCKWAKRDLPGKSALRFVRLTSALDRGEERRDPTRGSFALDEIPRLEKLTRLVDELPRGTLRRWLGMVIEDPKRAENLWARLVEVNESAMTEVGTALEGLRPADTIAARDVRTPLADALTWTRMHRDSEGRLWRAE